MLFTNKYRDIVATHIIVNRVRSSFGYNTILLYTPLATEGDVFLSSFYFCRRIKSDIALHTLSSWIVVGGWGHYYHIINDIGGYK